MRDATNTYHYHDTSISVWTTIDTDWDTYHAVFECLGRYGFVISREARVAKCIRRFYHHAQKRDLQAELRIFPAGMLIEFYQDVVHENPYGGKYDFDKVGKMPYHTRLYFQAARKRVIAMLEARGFTCTTAMMLEDQIEAARLKRTTRRYPTPTCEKDRDGALLADGEFRYARTHKGHLFRGEISWDGGNMWRIVANSGSSYRCASFELFQYSPAEPRKLSKHRTARLDKELESAVACQNFERAIVLRDIIGAQAKAA